MRRSVLLLALLVLLAACTTPQPTTSVLSAPQTLQSPVDATPVKDLPALQMDKGKGAISGRIGSRPADWGSESIWVFAAPYTPAGDGGNGFYVLEPTVHPSSPVTTKGLFQLSNVDPGDYVIIVGPTPERAVVVQKGSTTEIYHVTEGQVLELGQLNLR